MATSSTATLFGLLSASLTLAACAAEPVPQSLSDHRGDPTGTLGGPADGGTRGDLDPACARLSVRAEPVPAHLVVVLDRSNSMCKTLEGGSDCAAPTSRWQLTTGALEQMFKSSASSGIRASLIGFPAGANTCQPANYMTPIVANVTLPDPGSLQAKIASVGTSGSTPTRDALAGAMQYVAQIDAKTGGKERVAIVLATDGLPKGCADANTVEPSAALAAQIASRVPTFVVGIGPDLSALDRLAQAGGTGKAHIAASVDPSAIAAELGAALASIRRAVLSCELSLPAVPAGETLDPAKVNVEVKSGAGRMTLTYSAGCADAAGWRYDDAATPTKVVLCASACDATKVDVAAEVGMVVGCETKGDVR